MLVLSLAAKRGRRGIISELYLLEKHKKKIYKSTNNNIFLYIKNFINFFLRLLAAQATTDISVFVSLFRNCRLQQVERVKYVFWMGDEICILVIILNSFNFEFIYFFKNKQKTKNSSPSFHLICAPAYLHYCCDLTCKLNVLLSIIDPPLYS